MLQMFEDALGGIGVTPVSAFPGHRFSPPQIVEAATPSC